MILRAPLETETAFSLYGPAFLREIRISILQSPHPRPQILALLAAPTGRIYYSARLTEENNYSARPRFSVPLNERPFQLSFISYAEPRDLKGVLFLDLEEGL